MFAVYQSKAIPPLVLSFFINPIGVSETNSENLAFALEALYNILKKNSKRTNKGESDDVSVRPQFENRKQYGSYQLSGPNRYSNRRHAHAGKLRTAAAGGPAASAAKILKMIN